MAILSYAYKVGQVYFHGCALAAMTVVCYATTSIRIRTGIGKTMSGEKMKQINDESGIVKMIRISAQHVIGIMDKNNAPAARCGDGDTVVFETLDCSGGAVNRAGTRDRTPGKYIANPATGPLFVEGAMPGDVLKVEILALKHAPWGFMGTGSREKILPGIEVDFPLRIFDVSGGNVSLGGKSFPTNPMIGVIGVAPQGEGIGTMVPSSHGGNMDCTRIREGSVVYFPVRAPGALLAMGDLHAAMGDGEVFWYGL